MILPEQACATITWGGIINDGINKSLLLELVMPTIHHVNIHLHIISRMSLVIHIKTNILEFLDDISKLVIIIVQENKIIKINHDNDFTSVKGTHINERLLDANIPEFLNNVSIPKPSCLLLTIQIGKYWKNMIFGVTMMSLNKLRKFHVHVSHNGLTKVNLVQYQAGDAKDNHKVDSRPSYHRGICVK